MLLTPAGYAYLKISEGCDQKCTFCSIPSFRGRLVSRTIEDNVADARRIAARGVGEVNLVSQDTTAYGRDLYGKPRLAELVARLTEIEGPRWWRLLYLYPTTLRDDLLDEVARNPRVAKYFDLPVQHMSDPMLKAMRRGITAAKAARAARAHPRARAGLRDPHDAHRRASRARPPPTTPRPSGRWRRASSIASASSRTAARRARPRTTWPTRFRPPPRRRGAPS